MPLASSFIIFFLFFIYKSNLHFTMWSYIKNGAKTMKNREKINEFELKAHAVTFNEIKIVSGSVHSYIIFSRK